MGTGSEKNHFLLSFYSSSFISIQNLKEEAESKVAELLSSRPPSPLSPEREEEGEGVHPGATDGVEEGKVVMTKQELEEMKGEFEIGFLSFDYYCFLFS